MSHYLLGGLKGASHRLLATSPAWSILTCPTTLCPEACHWHWCRPAASSSSNQLSGDLHELPSSSIPGKSLQVINISSNMFTGQLTSVTWKGMENLVVLNASNNSFTGQIPSHFCNMSPYLAVLELCYNRFSGNIPPGLGNCSMLRVLKAGDNNLSGTLPHELFNATSLECLSFSSNGLQGILFFFATGLCARISLRGRECQAYTTDHEGGRTRRAASDEHGEGTYQSTGS